MEGSPWLQHLKQVVRSEIIKLAYYSYYGPTDKPNWHARDFSELSNKSWISVLPEKEVPDHTLEFWGISHILLLLPSDTSWKWTQRRTKGIISKLPQSSFRWRIPTLGARFKTAIFLGWARLSPHRKITETKYHWHTRSVRPPGRHVKSIHIRPFYGPFNFSFVEKISSTHANQIWVSPRHR